MQLLREIERHLRASKMKPTRFGRDAVRDPRFVSDLRRGREPRQKTIAKVAARLLDALDEHEFAIGNSFVADIIGKRGNHSPGEATPLLIEALTILA